MPQPKQGVAYDLNFALFDSANPTKLKVNPTIAVGDFQVSVNSGAFVNTTNLPAVTPAGGTNVKLTLTASEMGVDTVVQGIDQAGDEWTDLLIAISTTQKTLDDQIAAVDVWAVGTREITGNLDKTGYSLSVAANEGVADTLLDRDLAAGTDTGSATKRTVRQALRFSRNKVDLNTGTVFKEDDSTPSWTFVLSVDAAAQPIVTVDPAGP